MIDVNKAIGASVKTGKVLFGTNNAMRSAKQGRAKLILLASNCPQDTADDIKYYAHLSGVPLVIYKGSSIDLGIVCSKPFMVSALTIREQGDSDILKLVETEQSTEEAEMASTEETNA